MSKYKLVAQTIDEHEVQGVKIEVIEHIFKKTLVGIAPHEVPMYRYEDPKYAYHIKFKLQNGTVQIEPGWLNYMHGNLSISTTSSVGGLGGMIKRAAAGESMSLTEIKGTGEVHLEPMNSKNFLIVEIENDCLIADKGLFFAGAGNLKVSSEMQSNVSSALLGGEGLFQTKVEGTGIAIFHSPVPVDELECIDLNNDKLTVDGTFALLRTKDVTFKVEKSAKTIVGSLKSGEGVLQTFSGTGKVWIASTLSVRQKLY
jgi:uncharacterized protein (AIM24 family)